MKSSTALKYAFALGAQKAFADVGLDKLGISLYSPSFSSNFESPVQHSQMNLGDLVGSGHSARSPFASSLLKAAMVDIPRGEDVSFISRVSTMLLAGGLVGGGAGALAHKFLPDKWKALALPLGLATGLTGAAANDYALRGYIQRGHEAQQRNRILTSVLTGGVGAGVGALAAPEHRGRGALIGGAIGASVPQAILQARRWAE